MSIEKRSALEVAFAVHSRFKRLPPSVATPSVVEADFILTPVPFVSASNDRSIPCPVVSEFPIISIISAVFCDDSICIAIWSASFASSTKPVSSVLLATSTSNFPEGVVPVPTPTLLVRSVLKTIFCAVPATIFKLPPFGPIIDAASLPTKVMSPVVAKLT